MKRKYEYDEKKGRNLIMRENRITGEENSKGNAWTVARPPISCQEFMNNYVFSRFFCRSEDVEWAK